MSHVLLRRVAIQVLSGSALREELEVLFFCSMLANMVNL
jgi:hypothetical protein